MTAEFFTGEAALRRHFEQRSRQKAFPGGNAEDARAWQIEARQGLYEILGLHHLAAVAPNAVLRETIQEEGYTREEWRIETEEAVWMPFSLLIPDGMNLPAPLVICAHGHGSGGRAMVAGRKELPGISEAIAQYRGDYGVQMARAGFIAACPDARGFGERREPGLQSADAALNGSCRELLLASAPLGLCVQGLQTWDLMRLLDYLLTDSRTDAEKVGGAGFSGGGMQLLDFAALDTRVKAAVVSGYFYGVRESLQIMNNNCPCNLVPRLWESFDMGDIAALIAPRHLFIETGDQDGLNGASGIANVTPQIEIAQKVYTLLGGALQHDIFSGSHRWHGENSVAWLTAQLAGGGSGCFQHPASKTSVLRTR